MNIITVDDAKQHLEHLIEQTIANAEPTIIRSDSGQSVVLLPLDEYLGWQETVYLLSNPANAAHLRQSIAEADAGRIGSRDLSDVWSAWELSTIEVGSQAREPGRRRAAAKKALEAFETASRPSNACPGGTHALRELTMVALDAGELVKAKGYATALLKLVNPKEESWNYGNILFDVYISLGRIAIEEGDLDTAKVQLLEAGKTPGSPQLNSFGPSMSLAQALLEKGESDAVLDYLTLCGKFWSSGKANLDRWADDINTDRKPDFGAQVRD